MLLVLASSFSAHPSPLLFPIPCSPHAPQCPVLKPEELEAGLLSPRDSPAVVELVTKLVLRRKGDRRRFAQGEGFDADTAFELLRVGSPHCIHHSAGVV